MPIPLRQLFASTDPAGVAALLDENVLFHSPVADYRGRADVAHLLATIASCIAAPEPREHLVGATSTATAFVSTVADQGLDGVLVQRCTEDDLLAEATLLLRPLAALRTAISGMRDALAASPLPSALHPAAVTAAPSAGGLR